jgi:hypothetical protein
MKTGTISIAKLRSRGCVDALDVQKAASFISLDNREKIG